MGFWNIYSVNGKRVITYIAGQDYSLLVLHSLQFSKINKTYITNNKIFTCPA